jgi:hypothetical protein
VFWSAILVDEADFSITFTGDRPRQRQPISLTHKRSLQSAESQRRASHKAARVLNLERVLCAGATGKGKRQ